MFPNRSRPPPAWANVAVVLAACAAAWLLCCILRHSVAFLVGGVVLCAILRCLKDLTT